MTRRQTRATLTWSASGAALAIALNAMPAHAQLAQMRAAAGVPTSVAAILPKAPAAAPNTAGMAAASLRMMQNQARAQNIVSLAQQANAAARAAAQIAPQTVPNGLGIGGLDPVKNGVRASEDSTGLKIWQGASTPTQATGSDGKVTVTIKQSDERALLSWETFNVGRDTSLVFEQKLGNVDQTNWVVLNRVVGGIDPATGQRSPGIAPSQILGSVTAPGTVLVLNQNGILFGANSQVNVHSLIATSLDIGAMSRATGASFGVQSVPTTLAERGNSFLQNGLLTSTSTTLLSGMGVQAGDEADIGPTVEGDVRVESGARINGKDGGFVIIAAPKVVNAGEISAPTGQVSLQSGRIIDAVPSSGGQDSIDPDVRGLVLTSRKRRAFAAESEDEDSVENTATGIISAPLGYISLGATRTGTVTQGGVLSSTTSVARNGKISISGAKIDLLPNSLITITPDTGTETIPQSAESVAAFKTSKIEIGNRLLAPNSTTKTVLAPAEITFGAGSLLYAPSADVSVGAKPGVESYDETLPLSAPSKITVEDGAVIDVSGVKDFVVAASRNSILIDPAKRNELRDTPNYRENSDDIFSLNGATIRVDPRLSGVRDDGVAWVGSPLVEAASYYAQVGVTAAELMTRGGNVTLGVRAASAGADAATAPSVSLAPGAKVDFSGGWVRYEDGFVQTSKLLTADGRMVDVGNANPNDRFVGIVNGFTETQERFGYSQTYANAVMLGDGFERGYSEGRDAGSLTIKGSTGSLGAELHGDAFPGARQGADAKEPGRVSSIYNDIRLLQRAPSELPTGGLLNFQALSLLSRDNPQGVLGGGDIIVYNGDEDEPEATPGAILLADDYLSGAGLAQVALSTSGGVRFNQDSTIALNPGGGLTVDAGRTIRFDGNVTIPSGIIRARTYDIASGSIFDADDDKPAFLRARDPVPSLYDIVVNGQLSTRGRWVNDLLVTDGAYQGSAYTDGGKISLTVAPRVSVPIGSGPTDENPELPAPSFAQDLSGSILINDGAKLDVSAGGYVTATGDLVLNARGGDVSLINETTYFQIAQPGEGSLPGRLDNNASGFQVTPDGLHSPALNPREINARVEIADGAIDGHGFSGGGTFTLVTPDLNFGDTARRSGTELSFDFLSDSGFANYSLTSWNTRLFNNVFSNGRQGRVALLGTETVNIRAGETLRLTQSLLPSLLDAGQAESLRGLATASDVRSLLSAAVPQDEWDRRGINLTLGGLTELTVADGGRIEGSVGSSITTPRLDNNGTIRLIGGTITQKLALPGSYLASGREAIGIRAFGEIFGQRDENGRFDELADNAAGIRASDSPDAPLLSNRDLVADISLGRSIYLLGALGPDVGIRLQAGSVTDLSGASLRNPRAALTPDLSRQIVTGRMIDGGTIRSLGAFTDPTVSLFSTPAFGFNPYRAPTGTAPVEQARAGLEFRALRNSLLDISGASDSYDLQTGVNSYTPSQVWSDGGTLALGAGGWMRGTVDAGGGADAAVGGTLEWLDPVLTQVDAQAAVPNRVSADAIEAAGFDSLVARRSLTADGDVTLNLGRGFHLTSQLFDGNSAAEGYRASIGATGSLAINAPYVRLESYQQTITPQDVPTGAADVTFNARAIDIAGAVLFDQSIADVTLNASGDVRLIGVQPSEKVLSSGSNLANSLSGQLLVTGDLTIRAAQIYPTTGTGNLQKLIDAQRAGKTLDVDAFVIASTGADATIRFERSSDATPDAPYSAGGNLFVQAANIEQAGVLRVPVGKLTLGSSTPLEVPLSQSTAYFAPATKSVRLEDGSITSVSANGLSIPYGTTTDLIEYFFTPTSDARLTAAPAAELRMTGDSVIADAGATVDLSGGGDLYAYEFASGTGGSRDVLSRFNTDSFSSNDGFQYADGRQVYAIVPSLRNIDAALFDPIYSADYGDLYSAQGAGRSVYLEGGQGIAAGWYTLLPARYAMLPGGMRVVENVGRATGALGSSNKLLDGSVVLGGHYGVAGTDFAESERRSFTVQDQSTFLKFSRIELTSANKTFTDLAVRDALTVPRLPTDAARLVLNPLTTLAIGTSFNSTPATGGRGSQVDLTGQQITITAPGAAPAGTGITLTTTDLGNLNAASLLIGGTRNDKADGTTDLAINSQSIIVANDAANPLTAPEVVLAVDGIGSSIDIRDGAAIVATGTLQDRRTGNYVIATTEDGTQTGAGGVVRVANGGERFVERQGDVAVANTLHDASVTVGAAALDGDSLLLDSSRDLAIASNVVLTTQAIAVGGDDVNFATRVPNQRGFLITPELEAVLAAVPKLTINTTSVIGFEAGDYQFRDLTLNARGIRLVRFEDQADTQLSVTIDADNFRLAHLADDPVADRGACMESGRLACGVNGSTLAITADTVTFGNGTLRTYGFDGSVRLAATQGMFVEGRANLDLHGANLTLETPFLGDRAASVDPQNGKVQPSLQIATDGSVNIVNPGGGALPQSIGAPGASLAFGTIDRPIEALTIDGTQLRATAGTLEVHSAGAITATGTATLAAPGYSKLFGDEGDQVRVSAPGGALRLTSLNGDISFGAATRLALGGGEGEAGSLYLSAAKGNVALGGTIDATAPGGKASLALDTGGVFDLASFLTGAGSQFTGDFAIRSATGDLALAGGQTLRAESVRLIADGGLVDIAGAIDTSGVNGGDIGLFGMDGVTLRSTARIDAHSDGYAATDTRKATGGDVQIGTDGTGSILVDAGATIDVGARREGARLVASTGKDPVTLNDVTNYRLAEADTGGNVSFRAPIIERQGPDSVNISYAGTITGANEISVEAFKRFDLATLASNPAFTGVTINAEGQAVLDVNATEAGKVNVLAGTGQGTLVNFVRNFNISGATGLGSLLTAPNFHARPGMELAYSGDIVLASNWNLGAGTVNVPAAVRAGVMTRSALGNGLFQVVAGREADLFNNFTNMLYRVGGRASGEAGLLTFRAGGDLDIRGSVTDGFFTFADQTDPTYVSYQLGGGERTYIPYFNVNCGFSSILDCTAVSEFYDTGTDIPPSLGGTLNINLATLFRGSDRNPDAAAPYNPLANTAGALGAAVDGSGDPIGNADLFPLLTDGSAARSTSYRFVAGSGASADPLYTAPDAAGSVTVAAEHTYRLVAERGERSFAGAPQYLLNQFVDFEEGYAASAAGFAAGFGESAGFDPEMPVNTLYTRLVFGSAPDAMARLVRTRARAFFEAHPGEYQFFGGDRPGEYTSVAAPLELMMQFLQSIETPLANRIANDTLGYPPVQGEPVVTLRNDTVRAKNVIRTGAGSIDMAAARDIDLRGDATPIYRNAFGLKVGARNENGAQTGGAAVYTAGHKVIPGLVQATVAGTGEVRTVDPTAFAITEDYKAARPADPYLDGVLQANPAYASGGGAIQLLAGRDVLGRRDVWGQVYGAQDDSDPDYDMIGSGDQRWRVGVIGSVPGQNLANGVTNIRINAQLFSDGVGALGGGDVTVRAGRDVSDMSVVADTSVTTADADGARTLMNFGGGDVEVVAGRDVLGGRVDVASGTGTIKAGGQIGSSGQLRFENQGAAGRPLTDNLLRVRLSDATVEIAAGRDVQLAGIGALGARRSETLNDTLASLNAAGFYTPISGVSIAASGDVSMTNQGQGLTTPFTVDNSRLFGEGVVLPASLSVASLSGDIDLGGPNLAKLMLYPSAEGNLSLFAGGDINQMTLSMDDGDPSLLPGAFSAFQFDGNIRQGRGFGFPGVLPNTDDATRRLFHSQSPLHTGDNEPVRIFADGDINQATLSLPKQSRITAGRDITDMFFVGQNLAATDVTRIVAGRDITATSRVLSVPQLDGSQALLPTLQGNNFVLGGPGALFIEAGRDLGPFLNSAVAGNPAQTYAGGILTVGNEYNPWLGSQGAKIYASFGVANGADYDGLRDYYLDPANVTNLDGDLFEQTTDINGNRIPDRSKPIYAKILIDWMAANQADTLAASFGTTAVTADQAFTAFKALPSLTQRQFLLDQVYFNELAQTSRPDGPSFQQYIRGYRAVDLLYPASRGYTANDLSGAANGGTQVETGNLDLRLASIETGRGGDITIMGPGGRVLGGSVVRTSEQAARRGYDGAGALDVALFTGARRPADSIDGSSQRIIDIPSGYEGVLTLRGGAIRGFVDDDFLLNQSRLFTQAGGDITLWSSNGDLNAGQGPKSAANFPPVVLRFDPNGFAEVNSAGSVSGAGIAALQPSPDVPASDVTLIAPVGTVDAGDAGVRAGGNVYVAAAQVANADNFKVGGEAFGVPGAAGVDVAANTSGDSAAAAAAQVAKAVNPSAGPRDDRTRITVDVLGFTGDPQDDPCNAPADQRPVNCPAG